jgi:hypothetical protein
MKCHWPVSARMAISSLLVGDGLAKAQGLLLSYAWAVSLK